MYVVTEGFGTHLTATGLAIGTSNFATYFRVDLYLPLFYLPPCCAANETWNDVSSSIGATTEKIAKAQGRN